MQYRHVALNVFLPADHHLSKPVQPGVGALDHPAPRPIAGDALLGADFHSTGFDVDVIALHRDHLAHVGVVVAFVPTHMVWRFFG